MRKQATAIGRASRVAFAAVAVWLAFAPSAGAAALEGIHKIQHVIIIMQENRSFDSYFGTYPGATGIPAGVCVPDPINGGCVAPFHNPNNENYGGPHGHNAFTADLDAGKMDGFVAEAEKGEKCTTDSPGCSPCTEGGSSTQCVDSMGYHDAREIPNYWTYAQNFVLQDNMYEPNSSWSWPEHLFLVSAWSAVCMSGEKWSEDPMTCTSAIEGPPTPEPVGGGRDVYTGPEAISLPWTDITYLLHKYGVSWRYYVFEGDEPDCEDDEAMTCAEVTQHAKTPDIWNPLGDFLDVKEDGQREDIQSLSHFYEAVQSTSECGLPSVSWITPDGKVSEHPPALISAGQTYVTTLINAIMKSPCWDSSAIFLSWDDWGGFYDHVVPPVIDGEGYGFRVPGLVISPYAKAGYVDHQQLSHDSYMKFVENDFLDEERLNPATDGRPDSRPDVRENAPGLGSLENDFDFEQAPRPPLLLPPEPAPGPASCPPGSVPASAPAPASEACPYPGPPPAPAPAPAPAPSTAAQPPASPPAATTPPAVALALTLQLTASVAAREDLRLNHGRVYLMVGCNMGCSLYAHGHLSLRRDRRNLRLLSVHASLTADRSVGVALSLSRPTLTAVRQALREHRSVKASIDVEATGPDRVLRGYFVTVVLTWR